MSVNRSLAACFEQIASLMEIKGENAFKVSANRKVARLLEDLDRDISDIAAAGKLTDLDGIGKGTAKRIEQYLQQGTIDDLEAMRAELPQGLTSLLDISGMGPKTVGRVWREAGVIDRATLKEAIDSGALAALPRMGAKTIQNIADSLDFAQRAADRTPLGKAMVLAEMLVDQLSACSGVRKLDWAGSLRRGCETIGDIDLIAVTDDPKGLVEAFTNREDVEKVLAAGETKASVRLAQGVQVDLRIVDAAVHGATLMYFTGSKEHNVKLRERARSMQMRLNEYGLFPDDGDETPPQQRGVEPVAAATEADIYAALDLPMQPPQLRESLDDPTCDPPDLIESSDILSDLHAHTVASDGHLQIDELIDAARARGLKAIAITDHSVSSVQANGLSIDRLLDQIKAVHEARDRHEDMLVLAGSEVDIRTDGTLDYPDDVLAQLDIVVASPHVALKQDATAATERLLAAIEHPLVHIIGHPTGRMIGRRPGLEPDMLALTKAAAATGTALEINANPRRLDLRDAHVRTAVAAGCLIAINTDAHVAEHLDFRRYGVLTARRGRLTSSQCVNCLDHAALQSWLADKRSLGQGH
ncbi:MAG: DNA polymerase/3'-5' exonuclease PolX [Phycisphaerales bacterium]|nr:DNA polymerase/3'-5' exonuclease PolX [Phycisphaerales bacterium]